MAENENQQNIQEEENNNEQVQENNNIHENNNIENNEESNQINNQNEIQENNNINNNENNQVQNEVQPQVLNQNNPQIQAQNQNQEQPPINNNNINENNNNNNNNNEALRIQRQEEENKIIEIIKSKIKILREKYDFSLQFHDIITKILKTFQDLTYNKLSHSIKESLNFITFFKDSSELFSKFAKQIQDTNNIIMSSKKEEKLNDNILLEAMQKTQNILFENITNISNTMKQNIINKGPLSKLQEKINKIENIKKDNFEKLKIISESKKKLLKNFAKYDKIFDSYLPKVNLDLHDINNNIPERPSLIDTPDFILIIKSLLGYINKLILDINLFIIDTKDTLYKINGLYVEINNLVKDAILIYIKECKTIFSLDLTKNFEEIENYYKKLDEKTSDKMFKLNKIFTTKENEDYIYNLLQQYYMLLSNSNSVKKELLSDRNKFSIKSTSNAFLFFEWLTSVSPQPSDVSIIDLLVKQLNVKRDPGIFSSWKESVFMFTKQSHLLVLDKPGYIDDLVKIFELGKTSFRKRTDKKNKFLFELIANQKGKIMDFKGTFLFDALSQESLNEILNLVYSVYNVN